MIAVHIITSSETQALSIAEWLIAGKMAYSTIDIDKQETLEMSNGQLNRNISYKLQARTKSLLYTTLEEGIKSKFSDNPPFIYSTPIVNMDKDFAQKIIQDTLSI